MRINKTESKLPPVQIHCNCSSLSLPELFLSPEPSTTMASAEAFDRQITLYENPRKKKRSKSIHVTPLKPKFVSTASTRVHPCTECGKQFSTWKALFGHMRCHPERQWRGINPPLRCQGQRDQSVSPSSPPRAFFSEVDQEVAACLLMLANGSSAVDVTPLLAFDPRENGVEPMEWGAEFDIGSSSNLNLGFECSSCKKVFGTHQALGGHWASRKNVKGCFANARSIYGEEEYKHPYDGNRGKSKEYGEEEEAGKMILTLRHQCSICLKVFPSGQALGGHKRCHWEKGEDHMQYGSNFQSSTEVCCLDLNLPAPVDDTDGSSCSAVALELKLGI